MAKGRRVQKAVVGGSDYEGCTLVNVLRIPRISGGAWEKSNRGSLLLDTLCFPVNVAVEVTAKSRTDHAVWKVKVGGKEMPAEQARPLSIGDSVLTDTTTGKRYLVRNAAGDDAMPQAVKKEIIAKSKRRTILQRGKVIRKLLASMNKVQGIGNIFTDEEKAAIFNRLAADLNAFKNHLINTVEKKDANYELI